MDKRRFETYRVNMGERPKIFYVYYVSGTGMFPFDMLRYDACWPATGEDAGLLERDMRTREIRSVKLHSYKEPTIGRWSSFLWSVGTEKL